MQRTQIRGTDDIYHRTNAEKKQGFPIYLVTEIKFHDYMISRISLQILVVKYRHLKKLQLHFLNIKTAEYDNGV